MKYNKFLLQIEKIMQKQPHLKEHFFLKLYENLIQTKQDVQKESQNNTNGIDEIQEETFFVHFRKSVQNCKIKVKNLCIQSPNIEEPLARKIINILLYLNKDIWTLLQDGVLHFYMDLVEMKQKISQRSQHFQAVNFLKGCIQQVQPLLYEFFVYRQYKKMQPIQVCRKRKVQRTFSLKKKFSLSSNQNRSDYQPTSSTQLWYMNEEQINSIREWIKECKINSLLEEYLNDYEIEINQLEELCKICSKHIKISHLQEHVEYCQKKYILKQDITSLQNKILTLAQDLLEHEKNHSVNGGQQISAINVSNDKFTDLLFDIVNIHKLGSATNQSLKKITSQANIRQNVNNYEDILHKMQSSLSYAKNNQKNLSNLNLFISLQKEVIHLVNQLKFLQIEHQTHQQIVSSSTIRAPSQTSAAKVNKNVSRFATKKNNQISSKNSKNEQSNNLEDQPFIKLQAFDNQSQQNIDPEEDEQSFKSSKLKTKKSLNDQQHVNLLDEYNDDFKPQNINFKNKVVRKRSRKVKSMVMFDSDSQQQEQPRENQINQNQQQDQDEPEEMISVNHFDILKLIGKGAFGKVYVVRKKGTQDLYALKVIDIGQDWGHEQFEQIANEHEIFKKVAGDHLVQAPYCFSQGSIHVFMMQFMPGGDLAKVLEQQVYFEEQQARKILAEIVLAIEHLHNADIIHRDLKPQNLVIDEKGHLKLADFGLSEIKIQNKLSTIKSESESKQKKKLRRTAIVAKKENAKLIGTPDYIAPQIINGISINNKSIDWWSLGVIAYQIIIGARPFAGNTIEEVIDNILKLEIEWPQIGDEEGMISENAYDLIKKLLNKDFVNRLGAHDVDEIKSHPFFQGINWQTIKHQPASIMPNYAKIRELLEMQEDEDLRMEISAKTSKTLEKVKIPQLDNFIRFDILGHKTVKQAQKLKSKKTGTLKRLQSIKDIMDEKENELKIG